MDEKKPVKLVTLHEIDGKASPHIGQIDRALKARAEALDFVEDASALADFIGGNRETLGRREDWAISKKVFPGVTIHYIFNRSDDELPASLKVLFSGDRVHLMTGEDLSGLIIYTVTHMLRYVREANPDKKLPEVCYRV
jgi:hypothetical protein